MPELTLFTGKLDPTFPSGVPMLREVAKGKFPAVPSNVALPNPGPASWGMMNNDVEGDCTIAGAGHEEIVFGAISGQPTLIPTAAQCHTAYRKLTGGGDTGLIIAKVLAAQRKTGIFSAEDQLAGGGYARLQESSLVQIHEGIAFYGAVKLGIQCPQSAQSAAQQQMQTGEVVPWKYVKGSPIEGGHDIEAFGYDDGGLWCVSWGLGVYVTYSFLAHLCDEAWAPLPKQYREAGKGPLDIDWASLDAGLDSIAA